MPDKKIIAIDFDGVLHSFASGWTGHNSIADPPTDGAILWLLSLIESPFFKVAIFSARNDGIAGIAAMKLWLLSNGLSPYNIEQLEFPTKKPACHLLVDDRCLCFRGQFPTIEQMLDFVPWHGKGVW